MFWNLIRNLPVAPHADAIHKLEWYALRWKIVTWRVSWLTMLRRETPKASPTAVFTKAERTLLERLTPENKQKITRDLDFYVRIVARLGGYLDRTSDAPPGTTVICIWRCFSRLADLVEALVSQKDRKLMGNCKANGAVTRLCWGHYPQRPRRPVE